MQRAGQRVVGRCILGVEVQTATIPVDGFVEFLLVFERLGQVEEQGGVTWISFDGPPIDSLRVRRPTRRAGSSWPDL